MQKDQEEFNIGVLDIYGFEIFQVQTRLLSKSIKPLSLNLVLTPALSLNLQLLRLNNSVLTAEHCSPGVLCQILIKIELQEHTLDHKTDLYKFLLCSL